MTKKFFVGALSALMFSSAAFAQDEPTTDEKPLTNKNGIEIMPKAGDFAIGFNAVPVLSFIGNSFNGNQNNTYIGQNKFIGAYGDNVIFGKYMLTDNSAIRGHLRIGVNHQNVKNLVFDDTANDPDSLVTDKLGVTNSRVYVGAGYEMRRGKGRLRGIYGGELLVGYIKENQRTYSYGNAFGLVNPAPTSTSWDFFGQVDSEGALANRVVSQKGGAGFSIGVRPFVGVEYFFAPNISLGGEFGWSINYRTFGKTTITSEYFESSTGNVITTMTDASTSQNGIDIDTDNFSGSLFLMFYF